MYAEVTHTHTHLLNPSSSSLTLPGCLRYDVARGGGGGVHTLPTDRPGLGRYSIMGFLIHAKKDMYEHSIGNGYAVSPKQSLLRLV